MSDRSDDQMRSVLEQAVSGAPDPHPWSVIEHRAAVERAPRPEPRRAAVWLTAAACTVALVAGLVVMVDDDDEIRIDEPTVPTTTTPTSVPETTAAPTTTSAPTTTAAPAAESGWSGGLLDDLDIESLRPLEAYTDGDVILPTAPAGWRVEDSGWTGGEPGAGEWQVAVTQAPPDDQFGQVLFVRMSDDPACGTVAGCVTWGEPLAIDGVSWEMLVAEEWAEDSDEFLANMTVRAGAGDRWIFVAASAFQLLSGPLLEDPTIVEFLEGLRVGSADDLTAIGEACWQCDAAGGEGDPFVRTEVPTPPTTPLPDDPPSPTSAPPASSSAGDDPATARPLTDLGSGDVVVPTFIPPGLALRPEAQIYEGPSSSEFSLTLETTGGEDANSVRLWENGPIGPVVSDDPNHPHVEVAGLTWEWNDFERARIAHIGPYSVWVYLHGFDRPTAERFIEGLRAVPVEEFPGTIAVDGADGFSVVNGEGDPEVAARDDRFEFTAVQSGDQVCTKLEDLDVPPTAFFAGNCLASTMYAGSTIVDLYPLDDTDTLHLIIGVIDSPSATAVRLTSPAGESVVVPTGPVNSAIDGRFFLARLALDTDDGIRLDRFTIEDVSTDGGETDRSS